MSKYAKMISARFLIPDLAVIRAGLESVFSDETARIGGARLTPSAGHCAAVAEIIMRRLGGGLVSAMVNGESHWFNRIDSLGEIVDVDLTGDQFGRPPVQLGLAGELYPGTRIRFESELNDDTRRRAAILERRFNDLSQSAASATPLHELCA